MTAIDNWISDIQANRKSAVDQPIIGTVATCVLAWQFVAAALVAAGTVTSVSISVPARQTGVVNNPTTTPSIIITDNNQNANLVFAGPSSGVPAAPTFRSLVAADVPDLSATYLPLAGGAMTGAIGLPNGTAAAPALAFNTNYGLFYDTTNSGTGISVAGSQVGRWQSNGLTQSIAGGTTSTSLVQGEAGTTFREERYSNDTTDGSFTGRKARGTIAAPAVVQTNDTVVEFDGAARGATTFIACSKLQTAVIDTTPSDTAMGSRQALSLCAIGAATLTEVSRWEVATGLSMLGANVVLDANRLYRARTFTVATLPTAVEGMVAGVSDATLTMITGLGLAPIGGGANHVPVYSDGAGSWKII